MHLFWGSVKVQILTSTKGIGRYGQGYIVYTVCMAYARAYLSIIGHIASRELAIHTHSAKEELRGAERGDATGL